MKGVYNRERFLMYSTEVSNRPEEDLPRSLYGTIFKLKFV